MKVMIFSVTAGQGHNTTARVLADALTLRGHEAAIVDTFRETNRLLYLMYDKGYLLAASRLGVFYGWGYYGCENRKTDSYHTSLARILYRGVAKKLSRAINEYDPDVIVTTHPIGSAIIDLVKERHGFRARAVGISTDLTMHPYWEDALRFDRVVVACEQLSPLAQKKGFKSNAILPTGIPIHPNFEKSLDKTEARRALGIPEDIPVFLVMSGSMGHGNMKKTLQTLSQMPDRFGIITVCGRNEKAFHAIEKAGSDKLLMNLGYTDKISLLMDAADAVITKPGGLTTSEALAKELPIFICDSIPGQEVRNEQFLMAHGAALLAKTPKEMKAAISLFLSSEEARKGLLQSIELLRKPRSTADLCAEIENLYSQEAK